MLSYAITFLVIALDRGRARVLRNCGRRGFDCARLVCRVPLLFLLALIGGRRV